MNKKKIREKFLRFTEPALTQLKEVEYGRGYQAAKSMFDTEMAKRKEAKKLEEQRLATQAIDAISHAVTALARLIDGRDAR